MELVQRYWWVILLGLVVAVLVLRPKAAAQGSSIQQIGPSGADSVALEQISSGNYAQAEQARLGVLGTILSYISGNAALGASATAQHEQTAASIAIAKSNADAAAAGSAAASQLAYQQLAYQNAQAQYAAQTQQAAISAQNHSNNLNSILGAILGGFNIESNNGGGFSIGGGGGGYNTPPFF